MAHPTRQHAREETFPATAERLFALLLTPSAIRGWWGAARAIVVPEPGGTWAAAWGDAEDDPDYIMAATIRELVPPRRMVLAGLSYRSRWGPLPFEADFVLEFTVTPRVEGATLRVNQDGFPAGSEADAFYAACEQGWEATFAGIRRHLRG